MSVTVEDYAYEFVKGQYFRNVEVNEVLDFLDDEGADEDIGTTEVIEAINSITDTIYQRWLDSDS